MLQLKEENVAALSVEQEFELFQTSQKEETEKIMRLGRTMKFTAMIIIGLAVAVLLAFVVKVLIKNPSLLAPGPR